MHRESMRLQCSGCFATLSMTFTNAFYIETIFEMASSIYIHTVSGLLKFLKTKRDEQ
jgi:hypothetical protein